MFVSDIVYRFAVREIKAGEASLVQVLPPRRRAVVGFVVVLSFDIRAWRYHCIDLFAVFVGDSDIACF